MSGRLVRWLLSLVHAPRTNGQAAPRLTIVRHHRVYAAAERPLYRLGVAEAVLDRQLALLARAGLAPVTVSEGLERLAHGAPGPVVAMTFDDGYADNVTRALPLLARHQARATFYLTAGLMEERRAPWWDELAFAIEHANTPRLRWTCAGTALDLELAGPDAARHALRALVPRMRVAPAEQRARLDSLAAALGVTGRAPCELADWATARAWVESGMEVGAHTLTHPFLSLLSEDEQAHEIGGSIDRIEQRLGVRPTGLAYPVGDYDARTLRVVEAAGLAHAVTTRAGDVTAASPRFELLRRGLSEGACLGPGGRFSDHLTRAELDGAFDGLRGARAEAGS